MSEAQRNEDPLDRIVGRLPSWRKHGKQYLTADPFEGDEAELTCRTVTLTDGQKKSCPKAASRKARDHGIQAETTTDTMRLRGWQLLGRVPDLLAYGRLHRRHY